MALTTSQYRRGGSNGGITDADGRGFLINTGGIADSQSTTGSATAPSAGQAIAQIAAASLPAGVYRVRAQLALTGTAETLLTNGNVRAGVTLVGKVATVAGVNDVVLDRVTLDGTQILMVQAAAAATAGAIYTASLVATRVE